METPITIKTFVETKKNQHPTVKFQVIAQTEEWVHATFHCKTLPFQVISSGMPELSSNAVYIRGESRESNLHVAERAFVSVQAACAYKHKVLAAISEWAGRYNHTEGTPFRSVIIKKLAPDTYEFRQA